MIPRVSIVIPCYNCPYVGEAIESALQQTYPNLEIIVVNDGSVLYQDRIGPYRTAIRLIEKKNGGTASALNAGIRSATGDYIAWLSSDDKYRQGKLSRQIRYMMSQGASISFTDYDIIDAGGAITRCAATQRFENQIELYRSLMYGCLINGCSVVMKRELLQRVGLFDESLPYTHDYDLWQRVVLSGYPFCYLDETLLLYRVHEEMGTKKYAAAIAAEIDSTRGKYHTRLTEYVARLEGRRSQPEGLCGPAAYTGHAEYRARQKAADAYDRMVRIYAAAPMPYKKLIRRLYSLRALLHAGIRFRSGRFNS